MTHYEYENLISNIKISRSVVHVTVLLSLHFYCRDIFCAGRVVEEDLQRTLKACGGAIQTSVNGLTDSVLGTCQAFQEEQIGGDR